MLHWRDGKPDIDPRYLFPLFNIDSYSIVVVMTNVIINDFLHYCETVFQ